MTDWMLAVMPFLAVPIVFLFRFIGCESFGTAETPPDFAIGVPPAPKVVDQGSSGTVIVTLTSVGSFNTPITLTTQGVPGVSIVAAPNPVTPTPGGQVTCTLTITASPAATAGPQTIAITGNAAMPGAAPIVHTSSDLTLIVNAVKPDFTLSLEPPSLNVAAGTTTSFTVKIKRAGGFNGAVALTVAPAAAGIFAPAVTNGDTSIFTTGVVPLNTPPGPYVLTVTGTSGPLTRTAIGTVVVVTV